MNNDLIVKIELKLKQKSRYEWQLKEGAKVREKIIAVSGGWATCCKIFDTLERAIEYARCSREEMLSAFGADIRVLVVTQ